jgi:hypothetical protein
MHDDDDADKLLQLELEKKIRHFILAAVFRFVNTTLIVLKVKMLFDRTEVPKWTVHGRTDLLRHMHCSDTICTVPNTRRCTVPEYRILYRQHGEFRTAIITAAPIKHCRKAYSILEHSKT